MVTNDDVRAHGYTDGCKGCEASAFGLGSRSHSQTCRKRIEQQLKGKFQAEAIYEIKKFSMKAKNKQLQSCPHGFTVNLGDKTMQARKVIER